MPDPFFYPEVGQRTLLFVNDYISPSLPALFERDSIYPTVERTLLLQQAEEIGDPSLPAWSIGCGRRTDCVPSGLLASFYDMITAPVFKIPLNRAAQSYGVFDLSTGGLTPRRAFLLPVSNPTTDTLSFLTTDLTFNKTVRRAYSTWDFLTCFDPAFLPLDEDGLIFRNLDPISLSPTITDEAYAVVGGTSLSDTDSIPPAYAIKDLPLGLDFSSQHLTAGGTVANFLK